MYLVKGIAKCVCLISLNLVLRSNKFGVICAKYLGEGIAKCVTLTTLNLELY